MRAPSALVFLTVASLFGGRSARAQHNGCWQRDCPSETTFPGDSELPGVANAWTNLVALTSWARDHGMPAFERYKVPLLWTARPVPPDVRADPVARRYRTRIRETVRDGANFADHYALVWWGCGSPCVGFLIVDVQTGRAYSNGEQLVRPPMYRRDSRLIVEDPTGFMTDSLGHPGFPFVRNWEWTGTQLRLVGSLSTDTLPVRIQLH